ncbi:hypothetical protein JZ751_012375 [Albula glossodonta]|uniref:Uncharacterized protein n=1 Tax=Albula glossodonta TaxID=121402 RepID=A0A8T2PSH7_9TELE|nr:hypothetical protein JZ751_012375 [Albula glossodonta]
MVKFISSCRYTSCRAFLSTLNELNDYAGQHEIIAENLTSQIISELTRYIQELKAERKSYHLEGHVNMAKVQLKPG